MYGMYSRCFFWKKIILVVPLFNLVFTRLMHDFDANVLGALYYGKKGTKEKELVLLKKTFEQFSF